MIKHLLLVLALALNFGEEPSVRWSSELRDLGGSEYELVLSGDVQDEYYTHPIPSIQEGIG